MKYFFWGYGVGTFIGAYAIGTINATRIDTMALILGILSLGIGSILHELYNIKKKIKCTTPTQPVETL